MQLPSLIGHTQELLCIILKTDLPPDSQIDRFFRSHRYLGSHDRRFIAETVYGILRHLRKCEFMLNSVLTNAFEKMQENDRIFLLIFIFLFLQNKNEKNIYDLISAKLEDNQLKKELSSLADKLSKGIMIPKDSFNPYIGIEFSYPDWMVQKFVDQYGEGETEKICQSLNEQAPLTLRVNTLKTDVEKCQEELLKEGIETSRTRFSPFGLNLKKRMNVFSLKTFRDGWFEVQDEGSQLLPFLVDPKPNSKLLDVCAGAGGKSLEFAALMKNRGEIFAADINNFRLEELRKRAKRADVQNIRVNKIISVDDLTAGFNEFFDIVFVDSPCSGIGTLRRNPGMKWTVTNQTIDEVSKIQKSILHSSAPLVKPGGRLVYATCTIFREENQEVIEDFLYHHSDFRVVMMSLENLNKQSEKRETGPFISLFPHIHGTDGFFCASLEKKIGR